MISDIDNRADGDIAVTNGYATPGIGPGVYRIHTSPAAYYIPCGTKYAELLFNDVVDFDALGPGYGVANPNQNNTGLLEIAFALLVNRYACANIAGGHTTGGGAIKFGNNEYTFNTAISLPANVVPFTIEGSDNGSTIFVYGGATPLFDIASRSDGNANSNIHFKRIMCIGGGAFISGYSLVDMSIEDCQFINNSQNVVSILSGSVNVNIIRCLFYGNSYNASNAALVTMPNVTTVNIVQCNFSHNGYAISINGSNDVNIITSIIEYSTANGIYAASAYNISIRDSWFEGNDSLLTDCQVTLDKIITSIGANAETCYITIWTNSGSEIHATGVRSDVRFNTYYNVKGYIKYNDGDAYDFDRKTLMIKGNTNLGAFTPAAYGFIELASDDGNYLASYVFTAGSAFTLTKIAGSIANLTVNVNGVIETTATDPVMRITY